MSWLRYFFFVFSFPFNSLRPSDAYMRQWTNHHWFRLWRAAGTASSLYLNQCWNIVDWTLRNKVQWNLNRNWNIFIQENAFENVVWKMSAIFLGLNVLTFSWLPKNAHLHFAPCSCSHYFNELAVMWHMRVLQIALFCTTLTMNLFLLSLYYLIQPTLFSFRYKHTIRNFEWNVALVYLLSMVRNYF